MKSRPRNGCPARLRRLAAAAAAAALTVSAGGRALADDTEIFVQAVPPDPPNILLVLDTSGSMAGEVVVSDQYDPTVSYAGSCATDQVYYVPRGIDPQQIPDCGASPPTVDAASLVCEAALAGFDTAGFYVDRVARWDEANLAWAALPSSAGGGTPAAPVECAGDFGVHGDGVDGEAVYPADGAAEGSPWTSDEAAAIDWLQQEDYTLYSANYLNWLAGDIESTVGTRMDVLKDVSQSLVSSLAGVRMGLMRFSSDADGGMVLVPVSDIDGPGVRTALLDAIAALEPGGSTPLAETMYEAQRYYSGSPLEFGADSLPQPSVPSSQDGAGSYVSPTGQCQANYVVLLTDGLPTNDTGADDLITSLIGANCAGSCLDDLTAWMASADQSAAVDGEQFVETFTVGFFTDAQLLQDSATGTRFDGSPGYFTADDLLSLSDALREVFEDIEQKNATFQSPALAINGFNRLVNSNDLYFAMFVPSGAPHWAGNIKKYRLATGGGTAAIVDADGALAVGPDGYFSPRARSFWSAEVDGADVRAGGARSRMGTSRQVFTDTAAVGTEVDLWLPENRFDENNPMLTAGMLGVPESEREALIRFLRGVNAEGDANPIFGDPLHSNPTLVNFADGLGGVSPRMYVGTNDGYFHALRVEPQTDTEPLEEFAFIPAELLPRLQELSVNEPSIPAVKGYGLDGPISFWIKDDDGDQVVESGETLFVYFGMRRGGRNYYALRIPGDAPDQPTLAWTLRGGSGDFAELGQSWSAATVARMNDGGTARTVLVFGGGYDASSQDPVGPPQADSMGRAVFIVDAETGQRLWWAGNSGAGGVGDSPDLPFAEMTNSIPSDVAVIDSGGDGLADRLYVGDMGGRVWRFDLVDLSGQTSGTVLADLGTSAEADNLRFYYRPSISRVLEKRYGSFVTVAIGSGHRASPLSTAVDDRFFVLRDHYIFTPPTDEAGDVAYPPPITEANLLDITSDTAPEAAALNARSGWVLRLTGAGEKSLSAPLTADNRVFFTTYLPEGGFTPDCNLAGVLGGSRLYEVNLVSGAPVLTDDPLTDELPLPEERYEDLSLGGIPSGPRLVFTECEGEGCTGGADEGSEGGEGEDGGTGVGSCANPFSQVTLLMGTQARDPNICNAPVRTFWRQNRP